MSDREAQAVIEQLIQEMRRVVARDEIDGGIVQVAIETWADRLALLADVIGSPKQLVATTDEEAVDPDSHHIFTIRADGPCSVCGKPQKDAIHGT